jgi:hypothetical protein
MYRILDKLPQSDIDKLIDLQLSVEMKDATSHRRRMGVNRMNRPSVYSYSRYLTWNKSQRDIFYESFPNKFVSKSIVSWFVLYPKTIGLLDRLEQWMMEKSPAWITSYNLYGSGQITMNKTDIKVEVGSGITFPLNIPHEVKESGEDSLWACVMTMNEVI